MKGHSIISTLWVALMSGAFLDSPVSGFLSLRSVRQNPLLGATIYNVPGRKKPSWMDDDSHDEYAPSFRPGYFIDNDIRRIIEERKQKLARLAVVFSPTEIQLEQITDIQVLSFDNLRLSLEVIVCEGEGCVSIGIPLDLPMECHDQSEECILHNIDLLDQHVSENMLTKQKKKMEHDRFEWELEQMHRDLQLANVEHPSWWIQPTDQSTREECSTLQSLLNNCELKDEVNILARYALNRSGMNSYVIDHAMVTDIGNAGLIFSIRAHKESPVGKKKNSSIISASLAFETPINSATELRDTVLKIIDRASEFSHK